MFDSDSRSLKWHLLTVRLLTVREWGSLPRKEHQRRFQDLSISDNPAHSHLNLRHLKLHAVYFHDFQQPTRISIFDMCRRGGDISLFSCGVFMPPNWWWKSSGSVLPSKCELNPANIRATNPEAYEFMKHQMDGIPEHLWSQQGTPCCGSRFSPWARGASKIMEITVNGIVQCILCEKLPDKLDNEIKLQHLKWYQACGRLTPAKILACVPHFLPKMNLCSESKIGISRFDFQKWQAAGEPTLRSANWIALCKLIAEEDDSECFRNILSLCNEFATHQWHATECFATKYFATKSDCASSSHQLPSPSP